MKAAVIGATGMVGQEFLRLLANHPTLELTRVAASDRSADLSLRKRLPGTTLPERLGDMVLETVEEIIADPPPLVFSAMPRELAGSVEEELARAGAHVFSNAASHRYDHDVPVMVPEINADHLAVLSLQREGRGWQGSLITNPNCSTVGLIGALHPWIKRFPITRIHAVTYQALSGAGYPGVPALAITGNLIPHIPTEEAKIARESSLILSRWTGSEFIPWDIPIHASAVRVPVKHGHLIAMHVETRDPITRDDLEQAVQDYDPAYGDLDLPSAPRPPVVWRTEEDAPQPTRDLDPMAIMLGRVRVDGNIIRAFSLSHNLIRGSAGGSILNAELALAKGAIR